MNKFTHCSIASASILQRFFRAQLNLIIQDICNGISKLFFGKVICLPVIQSMQNSKLIQKPVFCTFYS
jgi:hypothetical protein